MLSNLRCVFLGLCNRRHHSNSRRVGAHAVHVYVDAREVRAGLLFAVVLSRLAALWIGSQRTELHTAVVWYARGVRPCRARLQEINQGR